MWQRSEDGVNWTQIPESVMRQKLAGTFIDVDAVVWLMLDHPGHVVRAMFAAYRWVL